MLPILVSAIASPSLLPAQGPRQPWTTSQVRGKPTPPDPYTIVDAFPALKFQNPTCVAQIPGTDRLLVTQQDGKIVAFPKQTGARSVSVVADLTELAGGPINITSAAFHPDFIRNRYLFVAMGHFEEGGHSRVSRFTLTKDTSPHILPGSELPVIRWPAGGHGGGCLQFGPEGLLWISTGDGSGPSPPDLLSTGQDISDLLGAVLRIDIDHRAEGQNYAIPADNPFINAGDARPEIWSYGLRNPWKFGIDRLTGDIFVADNGWETWEMIHKLHRGSNCGWPIMEGRATLRTEVPPGPTPITPPVKDHPHTEANSVIGGPIYRGTALPKLHGTFVYGDYITGTIWGLSTSASGSYEHQTLADTDLHIVALAEGHSGELYVLDYDRTGKLYELRTSDEPDTSASFPRTLSATGLFEDVAQLQPADGVVPYSVVAEPWNDGASARRWVAIPGDQVIDLDAKEPHNASFPEGTVLAKHLSIRLEKDDASVPLETQLLHYEQGQWRPYTYLWDSEGTEASLVDPQGTNVVLQPDDDSGSTWTWHVSSVNECRLCHNAGSGFVLGFTPPQLNVSLDPGLEGRTQLTSLTRQRVLKSDVRVPREAPRLVAPHDASFLEDRARSYLHVNCGICHNQGGPATISFFAHRDYPFDELRITKPPGIGKFSMQLPRLIAAGDPYSSTILYRIAKLGFGRMPYVGTRVVDSRGVDLMASWIKSMSSTEGVGNNITLRLERQLRKLEEETNEVAIRSEIAALLSSTEGALALAVAMHRNTISNHHAQFVLEAALQQSGDVRGLFEHFVPESSRRKTLGPNPDPQIVLSRKGDRARGELIFRSDNARCRVCHAVREAENTVGPTLTDLRAKYKRRADLLRSVFDPADQIDDQYLTWTVVTVDGEVLSGILVSSDEQAVQLRTVDQKKIRISRNNIDAMRKSRQSLMPEGTLSDLTPQEAADLLEYLLPSDSL